MDIAVNSRPLSGPADSGVMKEVTFSTLASEATLPTHNDDHRIRRLVRLPTIKAAGESGRSGIHPWKFLKVSFQSSSPVARAVNVLWPVVPAAIAVRYSLPDNHLLIFILSYVAMVPCANMIGFAGQELAKKVRHVFGVLVEITLGSIVEIVVFMVLLTRPTDLTSVIQAAILGSVLATMLLCLGLCFFAGGLRRDEQSFSETVTEVGSGLLLVAGFGLAIPTVFSSSMSGDIPTEEVDGSTLHVSRITAVLLLVSYMVYVYFQARTHHGIYDAIYKEDEARHTDGEAELLRPKLTLTEASGALMVSIALVTLIAISLVDQIPFVVEEHGVSEPFMGLILVPLVEKAAEHLSAVDEAWNDQTNLALSHCLGATLQTALFNGPLAVMVGWGLDKPMGLDFELFDVAVLILAIITVGNFLRDQKSNYLEGFLCVIVYIAIAVAAFYTPKPGNEGA